jgi:threonine synthase
MAEAGASLLSHLECARCAERHDADRLQTTCAKCGGPLYARYDLEAGKSVVNALTFGGRANSMWRYTELLPLRDERHLVTLGEGSTPLLHLQRAGESVGLTSLLLKDEGRNPTGTFKARGLSCCVSRNRELGARRFAIPTAGNAGGALATYAAAAGVEALVALPRDTPPAMRLEAELAGARLLLVDGTIADAAAALRERAGDDEAFNVSTFKEPYRLEGKKTMGLEIAEALGWNTPDVIVYPTGGGTGLLGIWKAFDELETLGLLGSRRPRMVAVQPTGCAPIAKAFREGKDTADAWPQPDTIATGLKVPHPFGAPEVLKVLRASRGRAVSVPDAEILEAVRTLAAKEGVFACPEGAATFAALRRLRAEGWIEAKETVVLLNTGTGLKYAHPSH